MHWQEKGTSQNQEVKDASKRNQGSQKESQIAQTGGDQSVANEVIQPRAARGRGDNRGGRGRGGNNRDQRPRAQDLNGEHQQQRVHTAKTRSGPKAEGSDALPSEQIEEQKQQNNNPNQRGGGRGRGRGRPRAEDGDRRRPQTAAANNGQGRGGRQGQNNQEQENRGGRRGGRGNNRGRGGRGGSHLDVDTPPFVPDFFAKNAEADTGSSAGAAKLRIAMQMRDEGGPNGAGSRKKGRQGGMPGGACLGSTAQALGDLANKADKKGLEKLKIIKEEDRCQKEKASVRYNFQDFLAQSHNLTDQCKALVESLSQGTQECVICSNPIYQRSALWNCGRCCQPFHLGCIKRWIKKLNNNKGGVGAAFDDGDERDDYEEEKVPEREGGYNAEDLDDLADDAEDAAAKKFGKSLAAFYSWTCPNCNYANAANALPRYKCYCGRYEEPAYNPMTLPHSCGEYCDRKKHDACPHGRCDALCHPGSCPPCGISVPVSCYCGKEQQRVPCQLASRSKFACENKCGKLLNCLAHECERQCHEGPCDPCSVMVTQPCFCGKEEQTAPCGSKRQKCHRVCGKLLDCGKHECERRCHEGPCGPCPRDPERLRFCPCGHNSIESLIGRQRRACTDPVPRCSHECEKFLPCGRHQCKKSCHTDACQLCEAEATQRCRCGKGERLVPCPTVNYPEELKAEIYSPEELAEAREWSCTRVCNTPKPCGRHKCKEVCCPVRRGGPDPEGRHICLRLCSKSLSCGVHTCNDFCHLGKCKPCKIYSREPLYCPCGGTKLDPPVKCGQIQPTCRGPCQKILPCGHRCPLTCHLGACPPCLEPVAKTCACGKNKYEKAFCNQRAPSCGQPCGAPLRCGHICQRICHPKGECFNSIEELLEKGCGQRCMKPRLECEHRCQAKCHPGKPCPTTPCEAEMRHYCKCGHRYVLTICKSIVDRPALECTPDCWKHQRDKRLAAAFSSSKDFEENKAGIQMEYYPEEALEVAAKHHKFVLKAESSLTDVVLQKSSRSFSGLSSEKRNFLAMYVYEHFKLEMCTYGRGGGPGGQPVTDVYWKDGCRVPEILASEVIELIEKGIMSADPDQSRNSIFEATLTVLNLPRGSSVDDVKKLLKAYQNEYYAERRGVPPQARSVLLHFYSGVRAKDAFLFMKNTPHDFHECELVSHRKQVGTNSELDEDEDNKPRQRRAERFEVDDDGFTVVTKK